MVDKRLEGARLVEEGLGRIWPGAQIERRVQASEGPKDSMAWAVLRPGKQPIEIRGDSVPLEAHVLLLQRLDAVDWRKVEIEERGGAFLLSVTVQVPALER